MAQKKEFQVHNISSQPIDDLSNEKINRLKRSDVLVNFEESCG